MNSKTLIGAAAILLSTTCADNTPPPAPPPPQGLCGPTGTADHPFSDSSPFNTPLGADAKYAGENDPTTRALKSGQFSNIGTNNGFGVNVYTASQSDPVRTIGGVTTHVPVGAGNGHGDSTVVIVDPDGTAAEIYHYGQGDALGRTYSINGSGVPSHGERLGVTASGVPAIGGLLRGREVNTPNVPIEHALQILLPHGGGACGEMLAGQTIGPATGTDWFCKNGSCNGAIPYGATLAIPKSVNLDALGLSEPGRRVAAALQNYGALVVDGNRGCPQTRGDQDISASAKVAIEADMRAKLYPLLRMVTDKGTPAMRPDACATKY